MQLESEDSGATWVRPAAGLLAVLSLVAGGLGGLYWILEIRSPAHMSPLRAANITAAPPSTTVQAPPSAAPAVMQPVPLHPLNSVIPVERQTLAGSDAALLAELSRLSGMPGLYGLVRPANVVRHIVATVDALPRRQVPQRVLATTPVPGTLIVTRSDEGDVIGVENASRYLPWVHLLTAVNPAAAAVTYRRFYPPFQQAYRELGNPRAYFNDRLIEALDDVLATPAVNGPLRIEEPSVMWRYVDVDLESLSAGQKLLLRMGTQNANLVRDWITAFRKQIA